MNEETKLSWYRKHRAVRTSLFCFTLFVVEFPLKPDDVMSRSIDIRFPSYTRLFTWFPSKKQQSERFDIGTKEENCNSIAFYVTWLRRVVRSISYCDGLVIKWSSSQSNIGKLTPKNCSVEPTFFCVYYVLSNICTWCNILPSRKTSIDIIDTPALTCWMVM